MPMETNQCNRRADIFDICEQICSHGQEYSFQYTTEQHALLIHIVYQLTGLAMSICNADASYTLPHIPQNKE